MQSLRTRKSQAPRRGQGRSGGATKLAKPGAGPTPRPGKSRVDDKMKKRMSMRYADISSPTELNGVPPMPTAMIPGRNYLGRVLEDEVVGDRTNIEEEARVVNDDKKLLDDEAFDPEAFLKLKTANSTEAEIKSLQSSLHGAKADTATELQRNVFKNYAEFVLISKEISTLENEMLELKESISEYKSMPSLLHVPDPTSSSSSSISTYRRSSVADLRIMYFNQMQALHAQIEGSAKFAPTTPGRHVVAEIDGVFSLNAATYKVMGNVKFVVLDDAVLVAKKRRRAAAGDRNGGPSEGKLVAERIWPLNDMLVLDTKDSPSMTNVFKIRSGKETHVYRTDTPTEKKALLQQFRHVAAELASKKRKEREGEHERRKSMWQGAKSSVVPPVPDWMADLAQRSGETASVDAKEKAERDARWTSDWADDLTVAIALREWTKAVTLIEEGRLKLSTTPPLALKLPALTTQLITSLLASLALTTNRKSTSVFLISLLLRLDAGLAARTTFLDMRSQVLKNLVRKIKFEGHIGAYVGDLTIVYFTGLKHSADWFLASFKENTASSSLIEWTKTQLEDYAEMFRRQVYTSDVDPKVVEEALQITHSQSKKLLQEYGLDFRFYLAEILVQNPKEKDVVKPARPATTIFRPQQAPQISEAPVPTNRIRTPNPPPERPETPPISAHPSLSTSSSTRSIATARTPSSASSYNPTSAGSQPPYRSRTPVSNTNVPVPASPPLPIAAPTPRHTRTPPPGGRERPPRAIRGSPAPPPRSTNRPGSSLNQRPPPAAVPQREGMI
ncbi:hypothetical protein BD779DRAFT_1690750 [Infundibulicybe gibba]|nr:hypothetical protein BD779DRAFT_1690750 [Infundibulicybe gibba]